MKLLRIVPDSENSIDEAIVLVPDDFDKEQILLEAADAGIDNPSIENTIDIGADEIYGMAEYRFYIG